MSDPSIAEFNTRIARIQKARAKGYGFEAEGTLGRSFYTRAYYRRHKNIPLLRPVLAALVLGVALKSMFLHQLGVQAYEARVAQLQQGEGVDRLGGFLMQVDPATEWAARQLGAFARLDG